MQFANTTICKKKLFIFLLPFYARECISRCLIVIYLLIRLFFVVLFHIHQAQAQALRLSFTVFYCWLSVVNMSPNRTVDCVK